MCTFSDGKCLSMITDQRYFDDQQSWCINSLGSNLVMIDSYQKFNDVLTEHQCWIGIELHSCNKNHSVLQFVNGVYLTNQFFVKWCDNYPDINLCDEYKASYVYVDATNTSNYCVKNGIDMELSGICGEPFTCVLGAPSSNIERHRNYIYVCKHCNW